MSSCKLHIAFDNKNERHRAAAAILDKMPRGVKVHLVAEAVLLYASQRDSLLYPTRLGDVTYPISVEGLPAPSAPPVNREKQKAAPREDESGNELVDKALDFFDMK